MKYIKLIFTDGWETADLSMTPGAVLPVVHVSQYDTLRRIAFNLDNAVTTSGQVIVDGTRPDGAGVRQSIIYSTGSRTIAFTPGRDFTEIAGDVLCEVVFTNAQAGAEITENTGRLGSCNFIIRVEKAGKQDGIPEAGAAVTITENGTYNVKPYAEAIVDTPAPSGTLDINTPGVHDVSQYEKVRVDMVSPSGTKQIVVNGQYNIEQYERVNVAVPVHGMDYSIYDTASAAGSKTLNIAGQRLTGLAASAFANNEAIGEAIINAGIIGSRAFANCENLTTVTLMDPTEIEPTAFPGSSLCTLTITGDSIPTLASNSFVGTPLNTAGSGAHIYVPADLVATYKSATNWAEYADLIEADPNE